MPIASLTRRTSFSAAHRLRRPDWDDAKNAAIFGLCAHPHFHGHSYVCDVTVEGVVDPETGMVVDLDVLDRVLEAEVRRRFDHRNINVDVPEFGEGKLIPTGENLARFIFERVQLALGSAPQVASVVVAEDATLWARYARD
jgi:6-pyruvoyltetrahydropterin/6-carboxytetrahydropterin synthase